MTTDSIDALLPLPPATFHILLALAEDDRHGYAIIQEVAARTGGELTLSAGTLYRSIQRMLEQGLIVETATRPAPSWTTSGAAITGSRRCGTRGRQRRGAPPARSWSSWRGRTASSRRGRDAALPAAAARSTRRRSAPSTASEMARGVRARRRASRRHAAPLARGARRGRRRRAERRRRALGSARQDLRYTVRARSRRTPGFALTAILVIALGVGANTAAFSVADFVLVRPLPFPESDRLVKAVGGSSRLRPAGAVAAELSRLEGVEHGLSRALAPISPIENNLVGEGDPRPARGRGGHLGHPPHAAACRRARPALHGGRRPARARRAPCMLSYGLWQSRFGGDGSVLGRRAPAGRRSPRGHRRDAAGFQLPEPRRGAAGSRCRSRPSDFEDRDNNYLNVARPPPAGRDRRAGRAPSWSVIAARLERQYPRENEETGRRGLPSARRSVGQRRGCCCSRSAARRSASC